MIIYTIPLPVSANELHVATKTGGKRRSDAYKAWWGLAGAELTVQRAAYLKAYQPAAIASGPWQAEIRAGRPDKRKRDVDNLVKATLDLMVAMQLAPDDSECQRVVLEWASHGRPEAAVILRPYDGPVAMVSWDAVVDLAQEIGTDYGMSRSPEAQGAMGFLETLLERIEEMRRAT